MTPSDGWLDTPEGREAVEALGKELCPGSNEPGAAVCPPCLADAERYLTAALPALDRLFRRKWMERLEKEAEDGRYDDTRIGILHAIELLRRSA